VTKIMGMGRGEKFGYLSVRTCEGVCKDRKQIYLNRVKFQAKFFSCIMLVVLQAIREWVGYVATQLSCILFIMLTTCFGQFGLSSGHKNVYRGKLYRV